MLRKKYRTDFFFPRINFWIGVGSVANIGGNYFESNYAQTYEEADSKAIENDWGMIGQDICHTINENPINSINAV
jgi:hypothetical protein